MKRPFKIVFFILCFTAALIMFCGVFSFNHSKTDKIKLKFSSWGSESETKIIKSLINEFEAQNPNINIEFVHIPQNYFQKLHLLFASNLAPDIVFLNNYYAPKYFQAGLLEDLTNSIEKEKFFDKAIYSFTFENKIYAIPRDVSELVVYYNKDIFKKNNIPYPTSNWSINDYKDIAKKLSKDTNNDGLNDIWGTSFETDPMFWLPFLMSNGTAILSDNGKEILYTKEQSMNKIKDYAQMATKDNIAPLKQQSAGMTMAQLFLQEKIAMHISGRWVVPKYREQAKFDWDIVEFPKGTQGSIVNIDSSGYAISKSSKHKKEALDFIEFMTSKSSMDKLSQCGLIIPALKEYTYDDNFLNSDLKPKNVKAYINTIENGKPTPVNADYQKLIDEINKTLEPIFLKN